MSNVIYVRSYQRRAADKPRLMDNETHQQLWNEFVGNVLAMELNHALSEPLDAVDMPELQKQRVRETGF